MAKVFEDGTLFDDVIGCSGMLSADDWAEQEAWAEPIPWCAPCAAEVLGAPLGELEDIRPWGCTLREPLDVRYLGLPWWLLGGLADVGDPAAREVLDDLEFERELAEEEAELARLGIEKVY